MEGKQLSDRFKLNGDEVNEVILNSPYSLADSPAALGQRASQTKRYFYQFINTLAEKINLHFGEIDNAVSECEQDTAEAHERIGEVGENAFIALSEHNQSGEAHNDIRKKITDAVSAHNESMGAHEDIREMLDSFALELEVALALASGKSRVVSFDDEVELFEYAIANAKIGDILLLEDSEKPDFTVYGVGVEEKEGDISLDINDIVTGAPLLPNKKYFVNGVRLVSTDGRFETSLFAKKDEVNEHKKYFLGEIESLKTRLLAAEAALRGKEEALTKHTVTAESVTLESMNEYHLGTVTALTVNITDEEFFEAILCFKTGSGEISVDAPAELLFAGDDTLEGCFYPVAKRLYEISVKRVSGVLLARVGSVDYEVIM